MMDNCLTASAAATMAVLSGVVVHYILLSQFRAMLSIDDREEIARIAEICVRETGFRLVRDATIGGAVVGLLIYVGIKAGLPIPVAAGLGSALGFGGTRYFSVWSQASETLPRVLRDLGRCVTCGYERRGDGNTCSECGAAAESEKVQR